MQEAKHRLGDLVDIARLQILFDHLSVAVGVATAVIEPDSTVLVASGWQDICTGFHRQNETTLEACLQSDRTINQHLHVAHERPEDYAYKCANGLWDVAFPLVVAGEHVANVFTGQFFYDDDEIDEEWFRRRAREYGFDEQEYMAALARVPVLSRERVRQTIRLLADLAVELSEMGLRVLERDRANETLREAEDALRASEESYRRLAEDMPIWVCSFLPDGTVTYVNPPLAETAGMTVAELKGRSFFELISEDDLHAVRTGLESLSPDHAVETHEQSTVDDAGERHWQQWTNRAIFDADGQVLSYQAVGLVITELKRAQQAAAESRQQYETFINATDDMAFLKDDEFRYVIVNEANARFFGATVDDVIGRTDADLMPVDAAANCRASDVMALKAHGVVITNETVGDRVYETRKFPVELGDGRVGVGGYVRDVTEQRRAHEEVARFNIELERRVARRTAELEAANRELESFSYSVSHDLRAPLRSIDGFSQILLDDYGGALDAEAQEHLTRIRAAAQKMAQITDGLLQLARLTQGPLERAPVDLTAAAREVAATLTATAPDRQVEWVIPDGLRAEADPALVRVVLENLLGNAWRFTGKHETARIEVGGKTTPEGEQAFYVKDDGAGFDMAYADKLFGAFQRLHTLGQFEGTGIGLATVERIVRRHGGRVWAEGAVEQGATFWFTLAPPGG